MSECKKACECKKERAELRAENERLRDALKVICNMNSGEGGDSCLMQEVADEALAGLEAMKDEKQ